MGRLRRVSYQLENPNTAMNVGIINDMPCLNTKDKAHITEKGAVQIRALWGLEDRAFTSVDYAGAGTVLHDGRSVREGVRKVRHGDGRHLFFAWDASGACSRYSDVLNRLPPPPPRRESSAKPRVVILRGGHQSRLGERLKHGPRVGWLLKVRALANGRADNRARPGGLASGCGMTFGSEGIMYPLQRRDHPWLIKYDILAGSIAS